jgi:hypothetical protein
MPKFLSKREEKTWKKAKSAFKKQKGRAPGKKDWPLVMHIFQGMEKRAVNIVIKPYEIFVKEGLDLVEQVFGAGYFSGVSTIVVQPHQTHHYGEVISDDPETIYISADRIEQEFAQHPLERAFQMASTLVHEMGHIKSGFKGGEGPAEAEEHRFAQVFKEKIKSNPEAFKKFDKKSVLHADLVRLANDADLDGHVAAADFLDSALHKKADSTADVEQIIQGIIALIRYMVSRVSDENKQSFKNSLLLKIRQISPELSQKRKNPSAGIGAVFGLLKNLMAGLDPAQIGYIVGQIASRAA